jgi:ribosome-associated toxin RatA of RatAB toxin-antitoxin module
MPGANHTEVFNCSVDEFYKLISDYESYPEFLQEVKDCRVVKADGAKKLVEYQVSVIKSFTYQMWMNEKPPAEITWTFAGGDIFKTSIGSWKLEDQGGKCKATYTVDATFSLFVPGPVAKTLLSVNLPSMMSAYHRRVKEVYGK